MSAAQEPVSPARRWGSARALSDDDEARGLLLQAAAACIAREGTARVAMGQVADEAGVARSTLYRYFPSRDDLLVALLRHRLDAALGRIVGALEDPDDAASSLLAFVLQPVGMVEGDPLNEALFSPDSHGLVADLELASSAFLDVAEQHLGPLLERWQAEGSVRPGLTTRETVTWLNAVSTLMLGPPWRARSKAEKRRTLEDYLLPALLSAGG